VRSVVEGVATTFAYFTGTASGSPFFATWNTRNFRGAVWLAF